MVLAFSGSRWRVGYLCSAFEEHTAHFPHLLAAWAAGGLRRLGLQGYKIPLSRFPFSRFCRFRCSSSVFFLNSNGFSGCPFIFHLRAWTLGLVRTHPLVSPASGHSGFIDRGVKQGWDVCTVDGGVQARLSSCYILLWVLLGLTQQIGWKKKNLKQQPLNTS